MYNDTTTREQRLSGKRDKFLVLKVVALLSVFILGLVLNGLYGIEPYQL